MELSMLIRGNQFVEAAVLAFKLNKNREFLNVLRQIVSQRIARLDAVEAVIQSSQMKDEARMEADQFETIVKHLMKLDKARLIKFIQKLISMPRDAHLSQLLINQILEKYQL